MKPAKSQDEFFDMRFCGTRGGSAFKTVQRPELSGNDVGALDEYACPKSFSACSTETSLENTICVATAKLETDCPLTFATFVKSAVATTTKYPAADYIIHNVDDDNKFVTSTSKGDSLPLTSFKLEAKPCLDHSDTSKAINAMFYPLEADRLLTDCQEVTQFKEKFDTRYVDMGARISEYDVQEESKVLKTLEDLPKYSLYVTSSGKENIEYGFWSRSTIPWLLDCEVEHPRDAVVDAAMIEREKESLNEDAVIWLNTVAYVGGFLATAICFILFIAGKCKVATCGQSGCKGAISCC